MHRKNYEPESVSIAIKGEFFKLTPAFVNGPSETLRAWLCVLTLAVEELIKFRMMDNVPNTIRVKKAWNLEADLDLK